MRKRRHPAAWAAALLLVGTLAAACGQAAPAGPPTTPSGPAALADLPKNAGGYVDITAEQLAALLANKNFALVNVHVPYEGEIAQTDLFIAYDEIDAHLDELPARDAPIVLYCRSGNMSTTAAEELVKQGYTHIYELDGGFNAWKAKGYELLNKTP